MATKAEERKALEQIRKIVEGLGKDSYIGMAFDGCFEIAEENIKNDWGSSMRDKAEHAERLLDEATEKYSELNENYKKAKADLVLAQNEAKENQEDCLHWLNRAIERDKKVTELNSVITDKDKLIAERDLEIVQLKAKLYDLITK